MNTNRVMRRNGEQGQSALLVGILLLTLIVVGMLIVMNGVGTELPSIGSMGKQCYEVIYNSGAKDIICQ